MAVTLSLGAEGECLGLAVRRAGPPAPGPGGQGDGESKHLPHVRTQGPLGAESVEGSATEEVLRHGPHPDGPVAKLLAANAGALGSDPGKGTGSCNATAKTWCSQTSQLRKAYLNLYLEKEPFSST